VSCIAFSPDGQYMVLGETGHQPRVLVFDWRTGSILAELLGHKFGVVAVRFSPDLCHVVSVGKHHDGFINVWDWRTGEKVGSNRATTKIHSLAFAPDGSFFVTVGIRHVKFW
ncbi:quinon protein alcohol dehydrogenase-like superfamily, partial [Dimargaris cristalligena]